MIFFYYFCIMKYELGKWLMDIAKYMVTAMLLSTVFTDLDSPIILWFVFVASLITLLMGLYLVGKDNNVKKKQK